MIIATGMLLLFLVYKEIIRVNRARLPFRLLAVLLAVTALIFLMVPIKYKVNRVANIGELQLLTPGTVFSTLKDAGYFTADSSVLMSKGNRRVQYIPDLAYYLRAHQEINQVKVYGYGLKKEELDGLKGHAFYFQGAPAPGGIISCSWPVALKQTELLQVQGTFNNTADQPVKLVLEGLGSKLDSVTIPARSLLPFSLKTRPGQTGRALYELTAFKGTSILQKEKIPFQVIEPPKIKLLVLSSFPDFEYKFLKNWLFENQYQVVFRTRVSKDKFSTDQLNTTAINAAQLNTGMLSKFDGVIADEEELSKLDPGASAGLRSAITGGLGLLIRIGDSKTLSEFGKRFSLYTAADSAAKSFTPVLTGGVARLKPLPASQYLYIRPRQSERPVVKDQGGKVLLSSSLYGNGKINASIITSTYHWKLTGATADYAEFWSFVISNTVRKQENRSSWRTIPAMPVLGQQTRLIYQSNNTDTVPAMEIDGQQLSPLRHTLLPYAAESTFWPQHTGWNELKTEKNTVNQVYVFGKADWLTLSQYQRLLENTNYSKNSLKKTENSKIQPENTEKEVSAWWFFALFLLSAGYIWFETKLL